MAGEACRGLTPGTVRAAAAPMSSTPQEAAKAAQLRYVSDARPGIRRRRAGEGFTYVDANGDTVTDEATLARIKALAIPPAWTDVWICSIAYGHLQASGRDAKGRKQYRYHARWRKVRDENKYSRMAAFGAALPRIREKVDEHLALTGFERTKVLAIVVRLLETTFIRVGNEEYARTNKSYGLTTLQDRHVKIDGAKLHFRFRGKSGKDHEIKLSDRRLARLVKGCRDLPGQDLFQYLDENGKPQPIDSGDVNDYLREISGEDFTAKDFRTWAGTLLAIRCLSSAERFETAAAAKSACVSAVAAVAERLGNTPAICRKCYIHPAVLAAFESEELFVKWQKQRKPNGKGNGLTDEEQALLRFLQSVAD
jgi:DNA topoisomerase I